MLKSKIFVTLEQILRFFEKYSKIFVSFEQNFLFAVFLKLRMRHVLFIEFSNFEFEDFSMLKYCHDFPK